MGRSKLYFDCRMQLWPLGRVESWAARQPLLRYFVHPDHSTERNRHIIIPVNEVLHGTESVVLPPLVLETLIARASCRVVMNQCLCRRAEHCQSFPREVGCLFLGNAAAQINPGLCQPLSPESARAYADHAIGLGLTPMIVHSAYDAELLGIDFHRMLAICFCCDCCCTVRRNLRAGPPAFADTILRFPGLHVEVGVECTGCGLCIEMCHVHALGMNDGQLMISDACKGCGSCARVCPLDAIHLHLDGDHQALQRLLDLVEERTTLN